MPAAFSAQAFPPRVETQLGRPPEENTPAGRTVKIRRYVLNSSKTIPLAADAGFFPLGPRGSFEARALPYFCTRMGASFSQKNACSRMPYLLCAPMCRRKGSAARCKGI